MKYEDISKEEFLQICSERKTKQEAYHKLNMHRNTFEKYCKKFDYSFDTNHPGVKYNLQDILDGKYPGYSTSHLHDRLLKEGLKERRCECCGNTEWMGHPIVLELHHIDGDHNNNKLENLQMLCPNCHSITDNFKSKKMKHYKL
jgi:hypothetical protein